MGMFTIKRNHQIFLNGMDTVDITFISLDMQDLHTIVTNNFEFTRKDCDNLLLTIQVQLDLEKLEMLYLEN